MIFERLQIEHFGHLADVNWELGPGLHLILGLNEAGKTTALHAIRSLLYRIPERSAWDYAYERDSLAVAGALKFQDGRAAAVRRGTGRQRSLTGSLDGVELDEDRLNSLVGASRELFENVFGFSLDEVQRGAQSLADAGVQETLYGVGLGIDIAQVRRELVARAEELFKERGQKQAINERCSRLTALRSQRSAAELRAADYTALRQQLEGEKGAATQLDAEAMAKETERGLLSRAAEAVPLLAAIHAAEVRRSELDLPVELAEADWSRVPSLLASLQKKEAVRRIVTEQLDGRRRELESVRTDEAALLEAETIESLYQGLDRIRAHRRDLPEKTSEAQAKRREITSRLAELRPGWDLDRLRDFQPAAADKSNYRRLVDEHGRRGTELAQAEAQLATIEDQLGEKQHSLGSLEAPPDVSGLRDLLEGWAAYDAVRQQFGQLSQQLAGLDTDVVRARRALDPPWTYEPDGEPEKLPAPSVELVKQERDAHATLSQQRQDLRRQIEEAETESRHCAEELERKRASLSLPTPDDLAAAREDRDQRWTHIRDAWIGGQSLAEPGALAEQYETAVSAADALGDRMREHADAVAERQQALVRARHLAARQQRLRELLQEAEQAEKAWCDRWTGMWERTGLSPEAPAVMLEWISRRQALLELCRERDHALAERAALGPTVEAYEQRLRAALSASSERPIEALHREAAEHCRRSDELAARRKALADEMSQLSTRRGKLTDERSRLQAEQGEWQQGWQAGLTAIGLEAELSVAAADEILSGVKLLKADLADLKQSEERVSGMEDDLAGYRSQVSTLAARLDPELADLDLEVAIGRLQRRHQEALQAKQQAVRLTEEIANHEGRLRDLDVDLAPLVAERETWHQRAGVQDDASLEKLAAVAAEAARLDEQDQDRQQRLEELRLLSSDPERFDALTGETVEALQHKLEALDAETRQLKEDLAARQRRVGEVTAKLDEHTGESTASKLELQLQTERASLAADVRSYGVLRLAEVLLVEEMERFEAENQPALLQRTGELFSRLTGDRYVGVRRRLGGEDLVAVDRSENALAPEQLSTGTRQQLYLALRLAYIEHYAERREPLPVILDDVLVNFDDTRAQLALGVLQEFSARHQVLFLTCHSRLVELAQSTVPGLEPLRLGGQ